MNSNINIGGMMANRAYLSPELECFVDQGDRYTFRQANQRVNQLAHYLRQSPFIRETGWLSWAKTETSM